MSFSDLIATNLILLLLIHNVPLSTFLEEDFAPDLGAVHDIIQIEIEISYYFEVLFLSWFDSWSQSA